MAISIPGGSLIAGFGGLVEINNWKKPDPGITGTSLKAINKDSFNVARWEIYNDRLNPQLWHSGCFGSLRRKTIATTWSAKMVIWMDGLDLVWPKLITGSTLSIKFKISADASWIGQDLTDENGNIGNHVDGILDMDPTAPLFVPYFAAPSSVVTNITTIDSSEGDEIVRQLLTIEGDSILSFINTQELQDAYVVYVNKVCYQYPGDN